MAARHAEDVEAGEEQSEEAEEDEEEEPQQLGWAAALRSVAPV